jgi:predicted ester cyclase
MGIEEQIAERDLVATRKTLRGELRGPPPTGNRVAWEFMDVFRVRDGRLVEHWTHMDFEALRAQMRADRPGKG